jgi:hypothetical protein
MGHSQASGDQDQPGGEHVPSAMRDRDWDDETNRATGK